MDSKAFKKMFLTMMNNKDNPYHPLVWINGDPEIEDNVYIGGMSEINARGSRVYIGHHCDIASFVAINVADSHLLTLGLSDENICKEIIIEHHVFIGSHSVIKGGAHICHHSVVAAGTIIDAGYIPPYSLIYGNPMTVKEGYYKNRIKSYKVL